jgi:hypothetical protein
VREAREQLLKLGWKEEEFNYYSYKNTHSRIALSLSLSRLSVLLADPV